MKRYLCLLTLFLHFLQVFATDFKFLDDFVTANRLFTADVYRAVIEHASGNLVICPIAAQILLGLARFGARDNTAEELILYIKNSEENTKQMFIELNKKLYSNSKFTLAAANSMFLDNKYVINNEFKGIAYGDFKAGVQNIDFSKTEEAIEYVNSWVETKTARKIKNFLSNGQISAETNSLFVNNMYFSANWSTQFDRKNTIRKKFYVNSKRTIETDMMTIYSFFNYYDSKKLDAQILQMPFEGDDVSLIIVLPTKKFGLGNLEDRISEILVPRNFKTVKTEIFIPKFTDA
ncbi:hypothetical protein FQR65_LT09178 [Abscondita terminalis]|nr:hypothetical protein FQR65_LT09178 [Abscondita terminalis]